MVNSDDASLVCWAPGGDSFVILDAEKFAEVCLFLQNSPAEGKPRHHPHCAWSVIEEKQLKFLLHFFRRQYYRNTSNIPSSPLSYVN